MRLQTILMVLSGRGGGLDFSSRSCSYSNRHRGCNEFQNKINKSKKKRESDHIKETGIAVNIGCIIGL